MPENTTRPRGGNGLTLRNDAALPHNQRNGKATSPAELLIHRYRQQRAGASAHIRHQYVTERLDYECAGPGGYELWRADLVKVPPARTVNAGTANAHNFTHKPAFADC